MKSCINCNKQIDPKAAFCPECGTDNRSQQTVQQKETPYLLIILCSLTIIGSIFTMGRAFLYEMVSSIDTHNDYIRGWLYMGTALGTLLGAVLMLQRKLKGLYIYSIFQLIYIVIVFIASSSYSGIFGHGRQAASAANALASGIAMLFLLPSLLFLIFYWTPMNRKHLK